LGGGFLAVYKTEQKKLLIDFLKQHSEECFTIEEIAKEMSEKNETAVPGLSTIYRLMPRLVDEGLVKRFSGDSKRRFLYQIVAGEHCGMHLHMKCTECGKLLHMNDDISDTLLKEIFKASNFSVDSGKTVLFGKCDDCK
jgi:Fur family ferric uptake transcriptional regulator